MGDVRIPVSSAELPADNNEKQEHSYRGCSSGGFCTARAVLAYIFGITFAEARTLHGAAALGHAAAEPRRLLGGTWREPSTYGLSIARKFVVRLARPFHTRRRVAPLKGAPSYGQMLSH